MFVRSLLKKPSVHIQNRIQKLSSGNKIFKEQSLSCVHGPDRLKVDFYFDTISPYSWPAFEILCRYKLKWDMDITWKPVFMGGLTVAAGNDYLSAVSACPNKAQYMFKDLESRTARFYDIPLKLKEDPISHIAVIGSLSQQRFVTAVLKDFPDKVEEVCRQIWIRSWSDDQTVHTKEDLSEVGKKAGLSVSELDVCLKRWKDQTIKEQLKETTEEAVERGCFGVPTLFFSKGEHEEMFWGTDRFDMAAFLFNKEWKGPNPNQQA